MKIEKVSLEYALAMIKPECRGERPYNASYLRQETGRAASSSTNPNIIGVSAVFYPCIDAGKEIVERFYSLEGHYYALITKEAENAN